jgi:hypothetical protein
LLPHGARVREWEPAPVLNPTHTPNPAAMG